MCEELDVNLWTFRILASGCADMAREAILLAQIDPHDLV